MKRVNNLIKMQTLWNSLWNSLPAGTTIGCSTIGLQKLSADSFSPALKWQYVCNHTDSKAMFLLQPLTMHSQCTHNAYTMLTQAQINRRHHLNRDRALLFFLSAADVFYLYARASTLCCFYNLKTQNFLRFCQGR